MHVSAEDDLRERLDRLEQRELIRDLKHRYLRACDAKDVAAMRACFVDGPADLDYGPLGHFDRADELVAVFERIALERGADGYRVLDMHHAVHDHIDLDGDGRARGLWTLRFRQLDRQQRTETLAAIEYEDRYVRVDGDWRVAACRARLLWSLIRPLPEDALVIDAIDG
jgi:hypothetical protein